MTDGLVVKELQAACAHGTDTSRVDRIIGSSVDLDGPVAHFSDLDAASSRAEPTDRGL
jgi:hypothetical protein